MRVLPQPGDLVGPYRLTRFLGAGAMGTVHEAEDAVLGRPVALKVIAGEVASDPAFRDRFVREARAMASVDSPHVVQVFAHGEADGRLWTATQLVPDGDLGALLRREGPLPPEVALELVAQVADGVAETHRVGLVHRDVKPANVLLRRRGTHLVAHLADFGLAAAPGRGERFAGTPGYRAPEVEAGGQATAASDVYSLGCLLRALLPAGAVRGEVELLLATALAVDPAARHPSAAALRHALRALLAAPVRRRRRMLSGLVSARPAATRGRSR